VQKGLWQLTETVVSLDRRPSRDYVERHSRARAAYAWKTGRPRSRKDFLAGITSAREFPKFNLELRMEALRVDGYEFFAKSLSPFTIPSTPGRLGGPHQPGRYGCVDARENGALIRRNFESGRQYALRLRVTADRIQAQIEDEVVIEMYISLHASLGLVPAIELSTPPGIASYSTTANVRPA